MHHDIQDLPGIEVVCDFWELPKVYSQINLLGKLEEIQMTHVLEHFPMKKVPDVLAILYDLLKKGGKVYIEVPNFYWHAYEILQDPYNRQIIEYAYGGQRNEFDYHYNGFTPNILHEDLETAGFKILLLVPNSSIECTAVKV